MGVVKNGGNMKPTNPIAPTLLQHAAGVSEKQPCRRKFERFDSKRLTSDHIQNCNQCLPVSRSVDSQ